MIHMFRNYLLLPVLLMMAKLIFAQGVGFGTNNPHPSALVDITSNNKGMLVPRLTSAQRTAIASPAPGLLVYDTNTNSFWFYNGTAWANLSAGASPWGTDGNHIFNSNTGRVGIGVQQPTARLTVDSGLVLDYSNSNNPNIVSNAELFFGNPASAGITSNKQPGSLLRSGLSFWTGGLSRIHIDSLGQVGIGSNPVPNNRLTVSGKTFLFGGAEVAFGDLKVGINNISGNNIVVNTLQTHDALLYLKGKTSTTNGWGPHIVMEQAGNGTDSAAILYDGDLKIRVFGSNDNITFRNAANTTTAFINTAGDLTVAGNLVANGNGLVQSGNSAQMQILMYVSGNGLNWSIGPGQSVNIEIVFSGFTGVPVVQPGTFSNATNAGQLLVSATNVTATSATITVRNVGTTTSVATNSNFRAAIIGMRN